MHVTGRPLPQSSGTTHATRHSRPGVSIMAPVSGAAVGMSFERRVNS